MLRNRSLPPPLSASVSISVSATGDDDEEQQHQHQLVKTATTKTALCLRQSIPCRCKKTITRTTTTTSTRDMGARLTTDIETTSSCIEMETDYNNGNEKITENIDSGNNQQITSIAYSLDIDLDHHHQTLYSKKQKKNNAMSTELCLQQQQQYLSSNLLLLPRFWPSKLTRTCCSRLLQDMHKKLTAFLVLLLLCCCCNNRCLIQVIATEQQQQQLSQTPHTILISNGNTTLQDVRLVLNNNKNNNDAQHLNKLFNLNDSSYVSNTAGSSNRMGYSQSVISAINRDSLFDQRLSRNKNNNNDNDSTDGGLRVSLHGPQMNPINGGNTMKANRQAADNESTLSFNFGCSTCQQLREKAKLDSLESIKMHILRRLQLTHLPNITTPITVPRNIIEDFYKNYKSASSSSSSLEATSSSSSSSSGPDIMLNSEPKIPESIVNGKNIDKDDDQQMQSDQAVPLDNHFRYAPLSSLSSSSSSRHNRAYIGSLTHGREGNKRIGRHLDGSVPVATAAIAERENIDGYVADVTHFDNNPDDNPDDNPDEHPNVDEIFNGTADDSDNVDDDDEETEFNEYFSRINRVYIFPTVSHLRHNHNPEILNFKFENNHSTISRVTMHLYVRGLDWLREYEPQLFQSTAKNISSKRQLIGFTIHRMVSNGETASSSQTSFQPTAISNATQHNELNQWNGDNHAPETSILLNSKIQGIKLLDWTHKIPVGMGEWIQIEMPTLADHWMSAIKSNNVSLIIDRHEAWMRSVIMTGDNNGRNKHLAVHIEVITEDKRRHKRSTSLDCQESDHEVRCCRYPLTVNFTNFGWHFVVAPSTFNAYFCNGECKVGYLEQYTHTHIASLTTSATPCCTPTKMSSLSLLYFNSEQHLVLSTIPNMSVEKCSCS